jgi:hypothetical protein
VLGNDAQEHIQQRRAQAQPGGHVLEVGIRHQKRNYTIKSVPVNSRTSLLSPARSTIALVFFTEARFLARATWSCFLTCFALAASCAFLWASDFLVESFRWRDNSLEVVGGQFALLECKTMEHWRRKTTGGHLSHKRERP